MSFEGDCNATLMQGARSGASLATQIPTEDDELTLQKSRVRSNCQESSAVMGKQSRFSRDGYWLVDLLDGKIANGVSIEIAFGCVDPI